MKSPHVVILGAGASRACCPNGDANGLLVPLTDELPSVPGIARLLADCGVSWPCGQKFEEVYDRLHRKGTRAAQLAEMERCLYEYFSQLRLPDAPTVYDYLLLALTPNDLVATFNWDPLLLQALRRSHTADAAPRLAFLHGCVAVGVCSAHKQLCYHDMSCPTCGGPLEPTKLLYPISDKNYDKEVIRDQWTTLDHHLENAYFVTFFGYSAPAADEVARRRMEQVWSRNRRNNLLQVEFIVKPGTACRRQVAREWADFLVGEHYDVCDGFKYSWLYRCPRRTCVALWQTTQNNDWYYPDNPFPECGTISEIKDFVAPLIAKEEDVNFRVNRWKAEYGSLPRDDARRNRKLASAMRADFLDDANLPRKPNVGEVIVRAVGDSTYDSDGEDLPADGWFKDTLLGFYDDGIETWGWRTPTIGRIPFSNIAEYDLRPDKWYSHPKIRCWFSGKLGPYERVMHAKSVTETDGGYVIEGLLDDSDRAEDHREDDGRG